ncbi:MAG: branched-chain amino acid ABC transporter permease [Clostridia bacterium]|nr:branched-chain amino acid ABC transporter permease [Clostridia bacterium]
MLFMSYLPYLLAGLSVGSQYALIAIGYTMVYGILRLINFAHGDLFMVSGILMIYVSASMPWYIAVPVVLFLTAFVGFMIERCAYTPLRSSPRMSVMVSAIGVSYLLQNLVYYITGGLAKQYPAIPFLSKRVIFFGIGDKLVIFVTPILVIVLMILLVLLINHTKTGMAMRAVSRDFETSRLMGIKVNRIISTTFVIGSFLAGVGAVLYFTKYTGVQPTSGALPGLKAFVAAVFGGIGSIPGAVVGAIIIGVVENLAVAFGLSTYKDAFTFVLLIIILIVKPTGIFGEKTIDKV